MSRLTMQDRVQAGARYLDTEHPGWEHGINLDKLHIANDCGCVIGQMTGSYNKYVEGVGMPDQVARDLGFFETRGVTQGDRYDRITEVWVAEIAARQAFAA